jgi:hypothetical protein
MRINSVSTFDPSFHIFTVHTLPFVYLLRTFHYDLNRFTLQNRPLLFSGVYNRADPVQGVGDIGPRLGRRSTFVNYG